MNNEDSEYKVVYSVNGKLSAEMIKIFLEAAGIPAYIFQESAGIVHGLTVGSLGKADIVVPVEREAEAIKLLADMDAGRLVEPGVDESEDENHDDVELLDDEN